MTIWDSSPSALSAEPSFDLTPESRPSDETHAKSAVNSSHVYFDTITPEEPNRLSSKSSPRPVHLPRGGQQGAISPTRSESHESAMRSPADSFAFSDMSKSVSFMVSGS